MGRMAHHAGCQPGHLHLAVAVQGGAGPRHVQLFNCESPLAQNDACSGSVVGDRVEDGPGAPAFRIGPGSCARAISSNDG